MRINGLRASMALTVAALCFASLGCSGTKSETTPSLTNVELTRLIPKEAVGAIRVNVKGLRASPHFAPFMQQLETIQAKGPEQKSAIGDLLKRTDELVVGVLTAPEDDSRADTVTILRGSFEAKDVIKVLEEPRNHGKADTTSSPRRVVAAKRDGFNAYRAGRSEAVQLDARTWVLNEGGDLTQVLARLRQPQLPNFRNSNVFRRLASRIGYDSTTAAILLDLQKAKAADKPEKTSLTTEKMPSFLRTLDDIGLRVEVTAGIVIEAVADAPSSAVADETVSSVNEHLGRARQNLILMMLGLTPIVSRANAQKEGDNRVVISANLSNDETRQIMDRITALARLGGAGSRGEKTPAPLETPQETAP